MIQDLTTKNTLSTAKENKVKDIPSNEQLIAEFSLFLDLIKKENISSNQILGHQKKKILNVMSYGQENWINSNQSTIHIDFLKQDNQKKMPTNLFSRQFFGNSKNEKLIQSKSKIKKQMEELSKITSGYDKEEKILDQIIKNKEKDLSNAIEFSIKSTKFKNFELTPSIKLNKLNFLKEARKPKYALLMSEQGEARLKLLKESERIDVLSSRDMRFGEYTSHILDKKIQFFNSTVGLSNEQEAMLKELMLESIRGENQNVKEPNLSGYLRLSELPIINASARRALTSNFAKILQQDMSASLKNNHEKWQKHSFRLEDGNNINMTSKNIDGILHIKLAASNPELNRLLMSMEQEIREHLKEELSLELDLQFENKEQGAYSDALGNNSDEGNKNWNKKESEITDDNSNQGTVNSLEPAIRNFGYNQMEWTA